MRFVADLFISTLVLLLTAQLIPGFQISSVTVALVAALTISILNAFVKPILLFLTLPINLLTLGLFTFVISACILEIASYLIGDFQISGFGTALLAAILIAVLTQVLKMLIRVRSS